MTLSIRCHGWRKEAGMEMTGHGVYRNGNVSRVEIRDDSFLTCNLKFLRKSEKNGIDL